MGYKSSSNNEWFSNTGDGGSVRRPCVPSTRETNAAAGGGRLWGTHSDADHLARAQ